jgi:S1-C subfamily serine protease
VKHALYNTPGFYGHFKFNINPKDCDCTSKKVPSLKCPIFIELAPQFDNLGIMSFFEKKYRYIKNLAKFFRVLTLLLLVSVTLIGIQCMQLQVTEHLDYHMTGPTQHYESFTLIIAKESVKIIKCISESCKNKPLPTTNLNMVSKGSGGVIAHKSDETYVITAAHVCATNTTSNVMTLGDDEYSVSVNHEILLIDYYGGSHEATVIKMDHENDICIVKADGTWSTPITIATEMVPRGERVFNMAAPRGMFYPGMVLTFEGFYAGYDGQRNQFFTIPAGPGSSGSIILNKNGQLISVIHSAAISFENVGLGSSLAHIIIIIRDSEL